MPIAQKIMSLEAAVDLIRDGDTVAIGGHTLRRHPMALIRQIVRAGKKDLHLQGWNNGIDMDLLIGAGCARIIETSYIGISNFGLARNYRRWAERGALDIYEHSETTGIDMFRAGSMGLTFFPTLTPLGSDLLRHNPHLVECRCPFTDRPYAAVRATQPDVAIIHAHTADVYGNVQLDADRWNDTSMDPVIARSARTVLVTVEQIVSEQRVRETALLTVLPRSFVTAVIEAPYGAHPAACDARYSYDLEHVRDYYEASSSDAAFAAYLNEWVMQAPSHEAYLEKVGMERLMGITTRRAVV